MYLANYIHTLRRRLLILLTILVGFSVTGCIGTDILELTQLEPEIRITSMVSQIELGVPFPLTAAYFNESGNQEPVNISWSSSNENIIEVDANGVVTGIQPGTAIITAAFQFFSDDISLTVGDSVVMLGTSREAALAGLNNYNVSGTALLQDDSGTLTLELLDDFTAENGPGLHVYLSNQPTNVAGGIDLGSLISNTGSQVYNVPDGTSLATYDYVLIYCKPFSVPFGNGQFEN